MKRQTVCGTLIATLVLLVLASLSLMSGEAIAQGDPTPSPELEEALERAANFSGGNADWTPVMQEFDGVEMVLLPAGCFMMGSTDEQIEASFQQCESEHGARNCFRDWYRSEQPVHEVCLTEPFWLDRYEVNNDQFERMGGQAVKDSYFGSENRPREQITWFEAQNYCKQRGARLPTEAEWEYAARGPDGLIYPWGNEFNCRLANTDDETVRDSYVVEGGTGCDGFDDTAPVGSFPAGASWVGALDMSGNVWEWVYSLYQPYPYSETDGRDSDTISWRMLRGGSWGFVSSRSFRAAWRGSDEPLLSTYYGGFRCARSVNTDTPPLVMTPDPTPEPMPLDPETASLPAGAHNADWTPVIQDFDGVEMVLVPEGCFQMGSTDEQVEEAYQQCEAAYGVGKCERTRFEYEQPVHTVCFDAPFWIDQTEVTRAAYMDCVAEGGCEELPAPGYPTTDHQPITQVAWFQAIEYCIWQDARLPTEAEWEYAARGPESWIYPWGNEFVWDNVAWWTDQVAEVGSAPAGSSWVGALDMSGNVSEHVGSIFEDYPYRSDDGREDIFARGASHAIRGGSTRDRTTYNLRAAYRFEFARNQGHPTIGFRCARSVSASATEEALIEPTPDPLQTEQTPVSRNDDWTPVIEEFDGVEMVLVPTGCFEMGSTEDEIAAQVEQSDSSFSENQGPQHRVCFEEPFWIDRTEVTNTQFAAFNGQAAFVPSSRFSTGEQPRVEISWTEAAAFCESRGARLPTEAEWEYAARGPDSLVYPWGNEWEPDYLTWYGNSDYQTANVGSRPAGVSWVGALDLSGNVSEWVADWYDDAYYKKLADGIVNPTGPTLGEYRVIRDRPWSFRSPDAFRTSNRHMDRPGIREIELGFRCARFQ